MFITIIFLISGKTIKSYCHGTNLENKNRSLHLTRRLTRYNLNLRVRFAIRSASSESGIPLMTGPCTFFSDKPEMSMDSFNCMRIILIYWFYREKHNTDVTTASYFLVVFLWERLAKVMTNKSTPFTKARFKTLTNDRFTSRLLMGLKCSSQSFFVLFLSQTIVPKMIKHHRLNKTYKLRF